MSDNTENPAEKTGENGAPRRPNAKYKLSPHHQTEDQLTFYYNREHRLAKAPQSVRDLYKEEPRQRFSLLRSLTGTRPRAMMFGSIVLVCVMILALSLLGLASDTYELDGNQLTIQALRYDGAVIVSVKKKVKPSILTGKTAAYTGAVDIAVSPALPSGAADEAVSEYFLHKLFFTIEPLEEYRFAVPFDPTELLLVFQTEQQTLSLKIQPE